MFLTTSRVGFQWMRAYSIELVANMNLEGNRFCNGVEVPRFESAGYLDKICICLLT